jgi:hypothetical protein
MACTVAENRPLSMLRESLNIPKVCHSLRKNCIHSLDRLEGDLTLGIPGAIIGYCQALFNKSETPRIHSQKVKNILKEINAPWYESHELFWGYKDKETTESFVEQSIEPLKGDGRIPILITGLSPASELQEIKGILKTSPAVYENETILLRIVLTNEKSVNNVSILIKELLNTSRNENLMPVWWPLLQGNLSNELWLKLKDTMGDDWKYLNVAVNPFTRNSIPEFCWEQVTVAQVVVGGAEGIKNDGTIKLAKGMRISGAVEEDEYNIFDYFSFLCKLSDAPTLIVLGPSLPEWDDSENKNRIEKLLPHLKTACSILWDGISPKRQEEIWKLSA